MPLPEGTSRHKRSHDESVTNGAASPSPSTSAPSPDTNVQNGHREIAGSRRVSLHHSPVSAADSPASNDSIFSSTFDFALPIHSDELARIPIFSGQSAKAEPAWSQFDMTPSVFGSPNPDATGPGSTGLATMQQQQQPPADATAQYMDAFTTGPSTGVPGAQFGAATFQAFTGMPQQMGQGATGLENGGSAFQLQNMNGNGVDNTGVGDNTLAMWSTAPEGFE